MREMSPQSSTHSTRFKSAGLQAARAGSHYSSSHDSKGMAVGDSCPDGNAWTNACSLLDFTAAATTLDKKDETFSAGYDNEPSDPAASSVLFWNRDESYDTSPMRNSGGGDCRVGRGTSNGPSPNKSISFSTTPQQQQSASIRRAGSKLLKECATIVFPKFMFMFILILKADTMLPLLSRPCMELAICTVQVVRRAALLGRVQSKSPRIV